MNRIYQRPINCNDQLIAIDQVWFRYTWHLFSEAIIDRLVLHSSVIRAKRLKQKTIFENLNRFPRTYQRIFAMPPPPAPGVAV